MATLTKQELKTLSDQTFFDNNNGEIEPSEHRNFNNKLIDAIPDPATPVEDKGIATFVVDSDAKLAAWAAKAAGNDYTCVLIKKGTWNYTGSRIDLTAAGTKVVIGQPGSLLKITANTGYCDGLYYSAKPNGAEYYMTGVNITSKNAVSNNNSVGFYNCINLTDCNAVTEGQLDDGSAGFYKCDNLANCTAPSSAEYGFYQCTNLVNCHATQTAGKPQCFSFCTNLINCTSKGASWGFASCRYLMFCRATDFSSAGFYQCFMSASGTTNAVADTAAGGYNRTV